jgi:germination protein M
MIRKDMARKKTSLGCLFWLALVLLVIVIFLFNQKNIENVLKRTGFLNLFKKEETPVEVTINTNDNPQHTTDQELDKQENIISVDPPEQIVIDVENTSSHEEKTEPSIDSEAHSDKKTHVRKARVYFVAVQADGGITLKSVIRSVSFDDSPLRETLICLLKGPSTAEINQGLLSIIPEGTNLRNVFVNGNTAFVDFSDDFRFNTIGQAGLKAQLKQVVYTVTEFSNVKDVQILIEGRRQRYLSPEGLYIAEPVSRVSIQN